MKPNPSSVPSVTGRCALSASLTGLRSLKRFLRLDPWEESYAPPDRDVPKKEITSDPSYGQLV